MHQFALNFNNSASYTYMYSGRTEESSKYATGPHGYYMKAFNCLTIDVWVFLTDQLDCFIMKIVRVWHRFSVYLAKYFFQKECSGDKNH